MARSKKYYKRKYKKYYRKKYSYYQRSSPRRSWRFANSTTYGTQMVKFRSSAMIPVSVNLAGNSYVSYLSPLLYNDYHKDVMGEVCPCAVYQDEPAMRFFTLYNQFKICGVKMRFTFAAPISAGKIATFCYDWTRAWTYNEWNDNSTPRRLNDLYLNQTAGQIPLISSSRNSVTLKLYPKGLQERSGWLSSRLGSWTGTILGTATIMYAPDDWWKNKLDKPDCFFPCIRFGVYMPQGGTLSTFCNVEMTTYIQFKDFDPSEAMSNYIPVPDASAKTTRTIPTEDMDETDPTEELALDPEYQEELRKERLELASKKAKERVLADRKLKRTD